MEEFFESHTMITTWIGNISYEIDLKELPRPIMLGIKKRQKKVNYTTLESFDCLPKIEFFKM